jgi:hypothetical protein
MWWERLSMAMSAIASQLPATPNERPLKDMVEELLAITRDQARTSVSGMQELMWKVETAIRESHYSGISGYSNLSRLMELGLDKSLSSDGSTVAEYNRFSQLLELQHPPKSSAGYIGPDGEAIKTE